MDVDDLFMDDWERKFDCMYTDKFYSYLVGVVFSEDASALHASYLWISSSSAVMMD